MTVAHDPYKYFRVEARELVEQLGTGLAGVEREVLQAVAVRQVAGGLLLGLRRDAAEDGRAQLFGHAPLTLRASASR